MFPDPWSGVVSTALMTVAAYLCLIIVLRIAGKRSLSKLNPFDFVVTVALGALLASIILQPGTALIDGLVAVAGLLLLQGLVASMCRKSARFARLVRSPPRLLLTDGVIHENALKREGITRAEVEAAIRKNGHGRIEDVTAVVVESNGKLSVICAQSAAQCSALRSVLGPDERSS
ncbi:DUF421 domain-containing protein [Croceicoccus sp. F390]|uniref:DUF421 domain-containing protein n=1 Tax=Croceicoccus esteveae TaxID=3075597 RepID=A0ABU2ZF32_9SPHN|nr:YetF domain-containing protein [Croceicoccus sp. F390]MDT0575213.1 DUF421 domain-containing protein [Croceicoccus sp. F390]